MASAPEAKAAEAETLGSATASGIMNEIIYTLLTVIIVLLIYKILKSKLWKATPEAPTPELPKLRKDMTVAELRQYDGKQPDGRVLVAVNGWIFDVTRGRRFYGPDGPYAAFGGKDASRGLATFSLSDDVTKSDYDDLSDLNSMEMDSVKEWEAQFREKYDLVGRLLKPGEEPTNYSDEEPEDTDTSTDKKDK